MERILAKFDVGKIEHTDFRFCGRRFRQAEDFSVRIDAEDNTRQIRKIIIAGNRKTTDRATETEVTSLRSVVGSLAWVARFARTDLCYRVNSLQRACATATVADLKEANRVVDLAQVDQRALYFPAGVLDWHDICIVTFSDASFAQEIHEVDFDTRGQKRSLLYNGVTDPREELLGDTLELALGILTLAARFPNHFINWGGSEGANARVRGLERSLWRYAAAEAIELITADSPRKRLRGLSYLMRITSAMIVARRGRALALGRLVADEAARPVSHRVCQMIEDAFDHRDRCLPQRGDRPKYAINADTGDYDNKGYACMSDNVKGGILDLLPIEGARFTTADGTLSTPVA
eukprot:s4760_g4.t1